MKIALDPFMHRHLPLEALPSKVAELGYEWIELSPRGDFLEWFKAPRVFPDRVRGSFAALADPRAIEHLVTLGVTAIELMPTQAFFDDRYLIEKGLIPLHADDLAAQQEIARQLETKVRAY